jgi:UDP-N-acetylglucosamine acyltransferase
MVGGASAVTQDIPPFCLAEGNRAIVKSLNLVGIRRRFEKSDVEALVNAYKLLFRSSEPLKDVVEELAKTTENEKVKQLCDFIITTKRGIPYERK